jgi:hypothetical protein
MNLVLGMLLYQGEAGFAVVIQEANWFSNWENVEIRCCSENDLLCCYLMATEVDLEEGMLNQALTIRQLYGLPEKVTTHVVIITISHGSDEAAGATGASIRSFNRPWILEIVYSPRLSWGGSSTT